MSKIDKIVTAGLLALVLLVLSGLSCLIYWQHERDVQQMELVRQISADIHKIANGDH